MAILWKMHLKILPYDSGKEVRLKSAYIVKCTGCTKDEDGNIIEIQAEYDPTSKSGMEGANRKVKEPYIG